MQAQRRIVSALAIIAAASSALAVAPGIGAAAASVGFCSAEATYSGTTITWTGKGDGHSWNKSANWSPTTVPDAHQTPATYQQQYVCIGEGKGGKPASVTIPSNDAFHVAGIDVGQGARLTVKPDARLFLGSAKGNTVLASSVDKRSQLQLDGAALGGNSPLTVAGTLRWTGQLIGTHKHVATQTSSECAFDPSISRCPGDTSPGGGRTVIGSGGTMLVDGVKFGGTALTDGRVIDNFGTITFTKLGYVAMDNGTQFIDEPHSRVNLNGEGGIFRGSTRGGPKPTIHQQGAIVRHGVATEGAVLGVPVSFGKGAHPISVVSGTLVLGGNKAPKASAGRATRYGVGTCAPVTLEICRHPIVNASQPQAALIGTSSESAAPKVSKIALSLVKGPAKVHGHPVLGRAIDVTAPTKKTSHSTHLTFTYDASTTGLKPSLKPIVYRGKHAITLCKVHGLTATNTSCLLSADVSHSGAGTKGDLTVVLITIQPNARWVVARR
jgi:hypothetical protein